MGGIVCSCAVLRASSDLSFYSILHRRGVSRESSGSVSNVPKLGLISISYVLPLILGSSSQTFLRFFFSN